MKASLKMTIIGIICIVLGCILFVSCSSANEFDWSRLSTEKFEQKTYTTEEAFQYVDITDITANITILSSTDSVCRVEYEDSKNLAYNFSVENEILTIQKVDHRKWYHYIGFNFYEPSLTIYLPEGEYQSLNIQSDTGDVTIPAEVSFVDVKVRISTGNVVVSPNMTGILSIKTSTGDIFVSNTTPAEVSLTVSTGHITADNIQSSGDFSAQSSTGNHTYRDISCGNATMISSTGDKEISSLTVFGDLTVESSTGDSVFNNIVCNALKVTTSTGYQTYTDVSCGATELLADTGKIHMTNLVSSDLLKVTTDTGDITLDNCDAESMKIKADTGDVTGTLRTPKIIYTDSDTGKVNVPHSIEGGLCEIETDTGNIKITFAE